MKRVIRLQIYSILFTVACLAQARAAVIDFMVAGPSGSSNESFVLPLSNPTDIEQARKMMTNPPSSKWLVVSVIAGKDGVNRNFSDPAKSPWSWRVTGFWGLSSAIPPENSPDRPSALEADPEFWLSVSGGAVGFFDYTVVAEFGPALELTLKSLSPIQELTFEWPDVSTNAVYTVVGTNIVYTLEYVDSLNLNNWAAVPGANWPLRTNQWTVPISAGPARYYRVRAATQ